MKNKTLSLLTLLASALAGTTLFADNEVYDGLDLSGQTLSSSEGRSYVNSSWVGANLEHAYLPYATLTDADFTGATLTYAKIYGVSAQNANFTDADLHSVDFYRASYSDSGSDLSGTKFVRANLEFANLHGATLTGVDFTDADITATNFSESNLTLSQLCSTKSYKEDKNFSFFEDSGCTGTRLSKLDLSGGNFSGLTLVAVDFHNSKLTGSDLTNANLTYANLENATLAKANLRDADFTSANLTGADLTGANLIDANVAGTDFDNSNLALVQLYSTQSYKNKDFSCGWNPGDGTSLSGLDLSGADFSGCNLMYTNFQNTNLTNANFSRTEINSYFYGATLTNANFTDSNMTYTYFHTADLWGADFRGATGFPDTIRELMAVVDTNMIFVDGCIHDFYLDRKKTFRIRAHEISAKLNGTHEVAGTLSLDAGATLDLQCASVITLAETGIFMLNGGRINLDGTLVNNGTIEIAAQAEGGNGGIVIGESATLTNTGMILIRAGTLAAGDSVNIFADANGGAVVFNQGTIKAFGGIYADGVFTAGTKHEGISGELLNISIEVGASVTITNNGQEKDVSLSASASIVVESVTDLDIAEIVLGNVNYQIGASWDFEITKDAATEVLVTMQIQAGLEADSLKIFHSENRKDWTDCTNELGKIFYDKNTGEVSFIAKDFSSYAVSIPEPSMFGLLAGLGALALVGARRRRR